MAGAQDGGRYDNRLAIGGKGRLSRRKSYLTWRIGEVLGLRQVRALTKFK